MRESEGGRERGRGEREGEREVGYVIPEQNTSGVIFHNEKNISSKLRDLITSIESCTRNSHTFPMFISLLGEWPPYGVEPHCFRCCSRPFVIWNMS